MNGINVVRGLRLLFGVEVGVGSQAHPERAGEAGDTEPDQAQGWCVPVVRCSRYVTSARTRRCRCRRGDVQDGTIECWRHGSRFDQATGAVLSLPAVEPVAVFAVRLVAGEVLVEVSPGGYPGPWDVEKGQGGGRDAGVV